MAVVAGLYAPGSVEPQRVLVTGGAGYIGSHCVLALLEQGHEVVVVDNLANGSEEALRRVAEITGRAPVLHVLDLLDGRALAELFASEPVDAVMHFAGLKAVGESVEQPLRYFENNLSGSINLFTAMARAGVRRLVFSSSATVYGSPAVLPVTEDAPRGAENPYGRTKLVIEDMLTDLVASEPAVAGGSGGHGSAGNGPVEHGRAGDGAPWRVALLRYFNPVGAHPSGLLGEDPAGRPNNLMPIVMQVAAGRYAQFQVFGTDYPTPDGTCIRDYIHVCDLAAGHLAALEALAGERGSVQGCEAFNLGTGQGHSVLEVLRAAEAAVGTPIPHELAARRPGDVAVSYADPTKAEQVLGWKAERSLAEMCADHWRWQRANPQGYEGRG